MTNQSIEQRLHRLESLEAIRELKSRYFRACDTKDAEAMRDCFDAGVIDIRFGRIGDFSSREELVAVFSELACHDHIVEMHHGQNPLIEVLDADSARGDWGLYYYLIDTQRQIVTQLGGGYQDEYRRVDGHWKISASEFSVSSTQILSLAEGAVAALFAGRVAPVEIDDPQAQAGEVPSVQ